MEPRLSRRSFIGFCLVMVLIIWILIWAPWRENSANAAPVSAGASTASTQCWSSWFDYGNPTDIHVNYAIESAASWCADGTKFVDGGDANTNRFANWTRAYREGIWSWSKWEKDRFRHWTGVGNAPDGTSNVEYETNVIWAEFKLCVAKVIPLCTHKSVGLKHQVWANGQSQSWGL
jgi:hypothetical protein